MMNPEENEELEPEELDNVLADLNDDQIIRKRSDTEVVEIIHQYAESLSEFIRRDSFPNADPAFGNQHHDIYENNSDHNDTEIVHVLKNVFGKKEFREHQFSIIKATLNRNHVIANMATGSGKSLAFQLPAIISRGVTFVLSPLIALIKDQMDYFKQLYQHGDIPARSLSGELSQQDIITIIKEILEDSTNKIKLVYLAPERLQTSSVRALLKSLYAKGRINRFVVDECHSIVEWGSTFRSSYLQLHKIRENLPSIPFSLFSATMTQKARNLIITYLQLNHAKIFVGNLDRQNLCYQVIQKRKTGYIEDILGKVMSAYPNECGLIYCISENETNEVYEKLVANGIKSSRYYAKLGDKDANQAEWTDGKTQVMVATVAFALGVNRSDVRFIYLATMPDSMETLAQMSGRGGRDGGRCDIYVLFLTPYDVVKRKDLIMKEKLHPIIMKHRMNVVDQLVWYLDNRTLCLRTIILAHFGQISDIYQKKCTQQKCTVCSANFVYRYINMTEDIKKIITAIDILNDSYTRRFTPIMVAEIVTGGKYYDEKTAHSIKRDPRLWKICNFSRDDLLLILRYLVRRGYIYEEFVVNKIGNGGQDAEPTSYITVKTQIGDDIINLPMEKVSLLPQNNIVEPYVAASPIPGPSRNCRIIRSPSPTPSPSTGFERLSLKNKPRRLLARLLPTSNPDRPSPSPSKILRLNKKEESENGVASLLVLNEYHLSSAPRQRDIPGDDGQPINENAEASHLAEALEDIETDEDSEHPEDIQPVEVEEPVVQQKYNRYMIQVEYAV